MGSGAEGGVDAKLDWKGMTNGIAYTDRTDTAIDPFDPREKGHAGF